MSIARGRFCQLALSKIGAVVLWAQNGPDVFDCSGLVLWALNGVGAKLSDRRAQDLFDQTRGLLPIEKPLTGDLAFYGMDAKNVTHVAVWLGADKVLSADGATSRITDLKTARAKETCRVRLHDSAKYRRDFLEVRRNLFLDDLDKVSR